MTVRIDIRIQHGDSLRMMTAEADTFEGALADAKRLLDGKAPAAVVECCRDELGPVQPR